MVKKDSSYEGIIFASDLDDFLVWTSFAYTKAWNKFIEYLLELFEYRLPEARTLGTVSEDIDHKLIQKTNPRTGKPYDYSMDRFPESLVRTYYWLVDHGFDRRRTGSKNKYNPLVERRIRAIGYEAFDPLIYQKQGLIDGAEEVLGFLKARDDVKIALVTKGETIVQDNKIMALDLDNPKFFGQEIYIVDSGNSKKYQNKVDVYKELQNRFPKHMLMAAGNSFNSDILPSLEANGTGIYVPYFTWRGEPIRKKYPKTKVANFNEIIDILEFFESGKVDRFLDIFMRRYTS